MRTALLLGATGLTGKHCLNLLLSDDAYEKVVVLTRRSLERTHDKLEQHIIDFDNIEASSDLIKVDDIFCCLGTTIKKAGSKEAFRKVDLLYPQAVAKIGAANGCKQFLVISAPESNRHSPLFYGRTKAEMEHAVCKASYSGTYIFRPSLLIGERDEYRLAEDLGIKLLTTLPWLLPGSLKKMRPIEASAVAAAMLIAAKSTLGGKQVYQSNRIQKIAAAGKLL